MTGASPDTLRDWAQDHPDVHVRHAVLNATDDELEAALHEPRAGWQSYLDVYFDEVHAEAVHNLME